MTKARDFADIAGAVSNGKIASDDVNVSFENITDTGTEGTKVASGTTAQRGSTTGQWRYNTSTGFFEGRNATGTFSTLEPTPTVSSVDDGEVDSAGGGNQTIVITGTNFTTGAVATFVGNAGANFDASTTTVNSATQVTAVAPKASFLNAQEPYKVKVTSASGVAGTSSAGLINVDNAPTWTTSAGNIGTVIEDVLLSSPLTVVASDAEGDTISYAVSSGSLPTGLSLGSANGQITGTPNVNDSYSSGVTHTFDVRATAGSKTSDRTFNILRKFADGSTSSAFATSASAIKTLTSTTTDGYYWIKASGMANPKQLWCDMNTDGGGYMRFWWFNTVEQVGAGSGLGQSWVTDTKFGIADISTITHTQNYGYGRIPSGVTPTKLMVKGTSSDQTSTSPVGYAIWTWDSNNSTSARMLASMQSGTTKTMIQGDQFLPSSGNLDTHYSAFRAGGQCTYWGYKTEIYSGGSTESTFDFNDDVGRDNTVFSAGYDGGGQGTDFFQRGSPNENATGRYLIFYWK